MLTSPTQLQNRSFHIGERTKKSAKCPKMKNALFFPCRICKFVTFLFHCQTVLWRENFKTIPLYIMSRGFDVIQMSNVFNLPTETQRRNAKMCRNFIFVGLNALRSRLHFVLTDNYCERGMCKLHFIMSSCHFAKPIIFSKKEQTNFTFQSEACFTNCVWLSIKRLRIPRTLGNIRCPLCIDCVFH